MHKMKQDNLNHDEGIESIDVQDWIIIAHIIKPHALKGGVKVYSYAHSKSLLEYGKVYYFKESWHELEITQEQSLQQRKILYFRDITFEQANQLSGMKLYLKSTQLETLQDGEVFLHQLLKKQVLSPAKKLIGEVSEVIAGAHHDILVIDKTVYVPYLRSIQIEGDKLVLDEITYNYYLANKEEIKVEVIN